MITIPLRILIAEDHKTDAELITYHLHAIVEAPEIKVVDNLINFKAALQNFIPDVILSDYNLPSCTGLDILKATQEYDINMPFIFITGTIEDEELAANTILSGASGFILKKNMHQLQDKLRPLLKRVVFNISQQEIVREKVRKNRIAVNQIYQYLDNIKGENEEQRENLKEIKKNIDEIELDDDVK
ncbi:response regulator receiver domain-containing protein [Gillisia sp. Hel_I_86]|uniref:response regulator n=1 Tax=Gillisia sp. Hel_I_86 TaxID=1249981 RepID=UPI001199BC6B|nr:response regulator [Gillisia sp. Hel_I_86]TVZ27676.1 response regulator receiver domain-containing protein [Gillisia sp. Hel_I_86]